VARHGHVGQYEWVHLLLHNAEAPIELLHLKVTDRITCVRSAKGWWYVRRRQAHAGP
jgi:hypothetical protein